jgi:hypothetical protein
MPWLDNVIQRPGFIAKSSVVMAGRMLDEKRKSPASWAEDR